MKGYLTRLWTRDQRGQLSFFHTGTSACHAKYSERHCIDHLSVLTDISMTGKLSHGHGSRESSYATGVADPDAVTRHWTHLAVRRVQAKQDDMVRVCRPRKRALLPVPC